MRLTLLFFLLLFQITLFSQSNTEYYDKDWEPCPMEEADFYREITYDENGKPTGVVKDYFITGELQFEGTLLSVNPDTLDGFCTWYYQNGQKEQEGTYEEGKLIGGIKEWSKDGKEEGVLDESGRFFSDEYFKELVNKFINKELDTSLINLLLTTGVSYTNNGDLKIGLQLFQVSHDISVKIKDKANQAIAYNNIGYVCDSQGQFKIALKWHQKAKEIQELLGLKIDLAYTYSSIGSIYSTLGYLEKALKWHFKASNIEEKLNLKSNLAISNNNIGFIYSSLGQLEEALKWYSKAKSIQEQFKLKADLATTYQNIGIVYNLQGKFDIALKLLYQAIEIQKPLNLEIDLTTSYNNIGVIYNSMGRPKEALKWHNKAKKIEQTLGLKIKLASTYSNIGNAYISQGKRDEGLKWYFKAKEIREQLNIEVDLAYSYNKIGFIYWSQGQLEEALKWCNKAKDIQKRLDLKVDLAHTYNNIGSIYSSLGFLDKALELHSKAKEIREQLSLEVDLAQTYSNIGSVFWSRGQKKEALNWYCKSEEIQKKLNLEVDLSISYSNIGFILFSQSRFEKALTYYNKSKEIRERLNLEIKLPNSYTGIAYIFYNNSQLDSTLYYVQKVVHFTENLRSLNKGISSRHLQLDKSLDAIAIGLLSAHSLNQFSIAYSFSEKGKSRGLLDLLKERSVDLLSIPNELKTSYESIQIQLEGLNKSLSIDISDIKRKSFIRQRDSILFKRQELEDQIKAITPEYANLVYPETIDKNKTQSILQNNEILVSFYTGQLRTFAFLLTPAQLEMIDLGPSDSLKLLVDQFRSEFIQGQKKALTKNDIILGRQLKYNFFQNASLLYQKLWAPLDTTGLLTDKKIIIVPDGFLHYLPFELLVKDSVQQQYTNYQYLIKDHAITYYPSATVLHFERTREREKPKGQKDFFGLAVEHFENNHCYESKQHFSSLSYANQEIKSIANCFDSEQRRILFDLEASEEKLKAIDLRQYRYLHFSTHGLINAEKPDFSRLLLQSSASQDGCLDLYEIFDLKLHADLVTLSACETGLGQLVRGEGMVGFTRALMYAGTPSVILSLWEVADASTADLFIDYYTQLQRNKGIDKYSPLRATQLKMIQSEQYANPYFWAPFVFIGEQ